MLFILCFGLRKSKICHFERIFRVCNAENRFLGTILLKNKPIEYVPFAESSLPKFLKILGFIIG